MIDKIAIPKSLDLQRLIFTVAVLSRKNNLEDNKTSSSYFSTRSFLRTGPKQSSHDSCFSTYSKSDVHVFVTDTQILRSQDRTASSKNDVCTHIIVCSSRGRRLSSVERSGLRHTWRQPRDVVRFDGSSANTSVLWTLSGTNYWLQRSRVNSVLTVHAILVRCEECVKRSGLYTRLVYWWPGLLSWSLSRPLFI